MVDRNWEQDARNLLNIEKSYNKHNNPKSTGIFIRWKNGCYFGSTQRIAPAYSDEIVLLSKTSEPLEKGLEKAIRRLEPERPDLDADDSLDIEGRLHVLRLVRKRLTIMTPEQMEYMVEHPLQVREL